MNSRVDSRDGGFQVPPEKQVQQKFQFMGSWIPITPTKPVQDSSSLITNEGVRCLEGGAGGYTERALYSNVVQDLNQTEKWMNRNEGYYLNADSGMARRSRLINCIAGSYAQTKNSNEMANIFAGGNVAPPLPPVTRNPIGNLDTANGNPTQYSGVINSCFPEIGYSQAGLREFELDELFSDQIPYSFSSLLSDGDHLCQGLQYGTPASNQPLYNLNSPPRGEANGSFSATTLKLVPTTPNQANNIENGSTHGPNFLTYDNSVQENGFLEKRVTTTRQGITQQNSDSNIPNIGDFSVVDSTTTKEQRDGSRQNDQVIGLKGTPQFKPLKRKKYMPKVVKENKPQKKAWKPATPANAKPKEPGTSRRKRARKTSLKESAIKESDTARQTSNSNPEIPAKSCRRALAFDLEKTGDVRQDHAEILQKVGGSNSVSETRVTTTRTISSCMDSVTQIDQNVQLLTPNQSFGLSTGNQHVGLSRGDKPSALPTGQKQPELTNGNQPARLLARDEQPKILIETQQHRFLIGRRKCDFPVANLQTQFSTEYRQRHFPTEIQPLGLPVGMQRSFLPMGNQQPRLLMGNQQSPLLMGNMQPGYLIENQHSGYLVGNGQPGFLNWKNQQACLATANQQSGLSIGMQQPCLPTGGQQPGLQMKNQQPGIQMRNQQPELLMKNQQPGSYTRNQLPGLPVMNRMPGNPGGFTSPLNKMVAAHMPSSGTRAHGSLSQTSATNLHAEILKTVSRKLSSRTAGTCHRSSSNEYGFSQQIIPQESSSMQYQKKCNGEPFDELRKAVPQNIQRSTPSILSKPFESRGTKRECNHATGQMQNHDLDRTDNWSLLQQIAQSQGLARGNIHIGAALLESSKKMKIQKEFPVNMDGVPYEVMEVKDDPNDGSQKDINNVSINEIALKGKPCPFQISVNNGKCIIAPPKPPRMAPAVGNQIVAPLAHASEAQSSESAQTKISSSRSTAQAKQKSLQHSGKTRGELLSQDPVADMIWGLQNLSVSGEIIDQMEQNSLVLYRGDGAVIPYEIKKRKPRPKVDLDEETTRIWDLLMGKGGNEGEQQMDKEKEKWWEEERRVLRGRVDSFIARMHLVQGDRRFSPWKGSVVDSVIGVFLTQNVTDHVSSSAFMSLAAIFPPKAHRNQADERNRPRVIVEDPEGFILNLNDVPAWQEQVIDHPCDTQTSGVDNGSKDQQKDSSNSGADRIAFLGNCSQNLENEILSSQDSFDPAKFQSSGEVRSCSGSTSDVEFSTTRRELKYVSGSTKSVQIGKSTLLDDFHCQGHGRYLVYEGSDNILVEKENIIQQKPRTERLNNGKDSLLFCQSNHVNWHKQVLANPSSSSQKNPILQRQVLEIEDLGIHGERNGCSWLSIAPRIENGRNQNEPFSAMRQAGNVALQTTGQKGTPMRRGTPELGLHTFPSKHLDCQLCDTQQNEMNKASQSQSTFTDLLNSSGECLTRHSSATQHMTDALLLNTKTAEEVVGPFHRKASLENRLAESNSRNREHLTIQCGETNSNNVRERKEKLDYGTIHWDSLRKDMEVNGKTRQRSKDAMDSLDYEALRGASVGEISEAIKERGMNNMLATRIKALLDRLVKDHGSIDLEWLRDVPPDKAKDYLLSIRGLGLKSVECVRLLTLHNLAFPVDTNVGRVAVRLGWVPLQPLPESLQLHLLELYPVLESIQKYLWPRLCKLDQRTLYELHYQLITFGKVFCTKKRPNCNACPMRGECRHFASAFASARLALPAPEERGLTVAINPVGPHTVPTMAIPTMELPPPERNPPTEASNGSNCEPIIEEPVTPEQECTEITVCDIEDAYYDEPNEIPIIELDMNQFSTTLQDYMEKNMELQEGDMSRALVALDPATASIPSQKLKSISRLRTEHYVYELPDSHPLLDGMEKREPDDPSPYLLAIWAPGETSHSTQPPVRKCEGQELGKLCSDETCSACNSVREVNSQKVRGTLLIPCRTAMRGSFPLNGTYFQVNEVFADQESSINPIDVPRDWIWNLRRRIVYCGTSVTSIFRGLSTEKIQYCFWKGFVCVRGFDRKTLAPRHLMKRLHYPASKLKAAKPEGTE